jgi:hypothetical protein
MQQGRDRPAVRVLMNMAVASVKMEQMDGVLEQQLC